MSPITALKASQGAVGTQAMGSGKKQVANGGQAQAVTLPADCRIADLADIKQALLAALAAGDVQIDAVAVERVDTAALQLLLAARRDARATGKTFAWTGVSDVLRDAAALIGLAQPLELPAATPA